MMPIAIDPSDRRPLAPPAKAPAPPRRTGRPILLAGLGCAGIVGLSAIANAMLSGLAAPPPRPKMMVSRAAADMPDLRDGVPALVSRADVARPSPMSAPREAVAAPVEVPPAVAAPAKPDTAIPAAEPASMSRVEANAVPKPAPRPMPVPPIENAALVPPARVAAPVTAARTAALVTPSPKETTRARPAPAVNTSFAALPPEPAAGPMPAPRKKPAPVAAVRTKPAAAQVAAASDTPARAAPEPEETEVFGLKVPSLAPAGRKLVEGVQALGDAVRDLPGKF